jgi:hypothetical protein
MMWQVSLPLDPAFAAAVAAAGATLIARRGREPLPARRPSAAVTKR